jgi:S1-C subfamily serine protease
MGVIMTGSPLDPGDQHNSPFTPALDDVGMTDDAEQPATDPAQAEWTPPPWQPPAAAELRHRRRVGASLLAAGLVVGAASSAAVAAAINGRSHSTAQSNANNFGPSLSTGPAPSSGAGSGSTTPSGQSTNPADIITQVDLTVADINTTLAGGEAAGTGIVITSSGEVLTNNHVVEGATSISVQINGQGQTYSARVLGVDPADDIALIQLDNASGLHAANTGDSSTASVGDEVIAIGNALGRGGSPRATQGAITALNQTITATDSGGGNPETLNGLLQINAQILPGDSGGPLVNASGQVIGMDTAASLGRSFRRQGSSVAFAIPINTAMAIVHQIESGNSGGNIQSGQGALLGVQVADTAPGATSGALIAGVQQNSPAASAGMSAGDVIVAIDGTGIDSASALGTAIHKHRPGDRVTVAWVDQSGQRHSASVQLTAGPPA